MVAFLAYFWERLCGVMRGHLATTCDLGTLPNPATQIFDSTHNCGPTVSITDHLLRTKIYIFSDSIFGRNFTVFYIGGASKAWFRFELW
jgi:hypothetical protein